MPSANIYAGVTQGLGQVAQYQRERPERDARMAEAKARQKKSEIELSEYIGNTDNRKEMAEMEMAKVKNELFTLQTESLKNATFSAFKSFNADQDPRHLNAFLQQAKGNPRGQSTWGDIARFDQISNTPDAMGHLAKMGYTGNVAEAIVSGAQSSDYPSFVWATDTSGNRTMVDMDAIQQGTGYTKHMLDEELATSMTRARIKQLNDPTRSADSASIDKLFEDMKKTDDTVTYEDALNTYYGIKNSQKRTGSVIEREADRLQQDNPNMDRTQALTQAKLTLESRTSQVKNVEASNATVTALNAMNTEGGDYFDMDLSDPKVRQRSGALISDYMQTRGITFSSADKKVARQYRNLLDLGNTASVELSDAETGLMDNMFHGFKKYFTDNVKGIEGTTAYHSFRNVMRNALMGATLTAQEIKSFDKAAGTLGQRLGPVLGAMKTSMTDVRNNLQSMATDMDPYVAKHFLGRDVEAAEQSIDAIDERIRRITEMEKLSTTVTNTSVKDLAKQKTVAPKVQVNIPVEATSSNAPPTESISDFFSSRKGN